MKTYYLFTPKNAIFSLSPQNTENLGEGVLSEKSLKTKLSEANKFMDEYKKLSGNSLPSGITETSAASKADYPITKKSTNGNTLRFREIGNGVLQRDNGGMYLTDPATGTIYGSNSNTYKKLLSTTYTMDSDGIPYIKIPTTAPRVGGGSGKSKTGGKGNGISIPNIKDILGGTIGGTGKDQRAFITDPNTQPEPPQMPLSGQPTVMPTVDSSKTAVYPTAGTPKEEEEKKDIGSFLKNVVPNLGRVAVAAASYDGSNQQYEKSPEWNSYVADLKQQTTQGTDPLLLSNIGRQYGMQLSAIRSAGGGGMTGGALAGVMSNTASQLNDSVLAADREAFMRRYNALGMYGNALGQNESARVMNFQNTYNKTQQQNAMAGQLAQSAIDDIALRNESDKTGNLEEQYLKSLVDNQKQVSELLKRQTNALFSNGK